MSWVTIIVDPNDNIPNIQWQFQEFCPGCSYSTLKKFRVFRDVSVNTGRNSRFGLKKKKQKETRPRSFTSTKRPRESNGPIAPENSKAHFFFFLILTYIFALALLHTCFTYPVSSRFFFKSTFLFSYFFSFFVLIS